MAGPSQAIPHISVTLPSYLRSGKAAELSKACQSKQIRFVDPEFKPQYESLFKGSPDLAERYRWKDFQWARALDVLGEEEFSLFNDIIPQNLIQGNLENDYMLCALAALAERPALIRRLFDTDRPNSEGLYAVWLNISGVWQQVLIDDFFPIEIHGNACAFAFTRTKEDEIWPMILEKAYAKAYGSYDMIGAGDIMHTLRDLTGAPYEILENISGDAEELWKQLTSACENNFIVVAYRSEPGSASDSRLMQPGQSHNVVDCVEVNDSYGRPSRLVLIRNVWSDWKWAGDWSDKSQLWTTDLKRKLADWDSDEGLCWLSVQDFVQFYQTVGICQVEAFNFYNSVRIQDNIGQGKHAIRFDVDSTGIYTVSIDQKDPRFSSQGQIGPGIKSQNSYFRVLVGKLTASDIEFRACRLSHLRSIFVKTKLEAGSYIVLIDAYWERSSIKEFTFGIYGPGRSGIKKMSSNETIFHGAEFEIWRHFSLLHSNKFNRQGTYIVGENTIAATVSKFNVQDMRYGISLNRWDHERGSVAVIKGFRSTSRKNLEVVTESGCGDDHFVSLNPNSSTVEVFKLDPRQSDFQLTQQPYAMELVEGPMPAPRSVRQLLLAYSADIPVFSQGHSGSVGLLGSPPKRQTAGYGNSNYNDAPPPSEANVRRQAPPKSVRSSINKEPFQADNHHQQPPTSGAFVRKDLYQGEPQFIADQRRLDFSTLRGQTGNYANPGPTIFGDSQLPPTFGHKNLGRTTQARADEKEDCTLI
jgi:hypothetical protein